MLHDILFSDVDGLHFVVYDYIGLRVGALASLVGHIGLVVGHERLHENHYSCDVVHDFFFFAPPSVRGFHDFVGGSFWLV